MQVAVCTGYNEWLSLEEKRVWVVCERMDGVTDEMDGDRWTGKQTDRQTETRQTEGRRDSDLFRLLLGGLLVAGCWRGLGSGSSSLLGLSSLPAQYLTTGFLAPFCRTCGL